MIENESCIYIPNCFETNETSCDDSDTELWNFVGDYQGNRLDNILHESIPIITEYALYGLFVDESKSLLTLYIDSAISIDTNDTESIFKGEAFYKFKRTLEHLMDIHTVKQYKKVTLVNTPSMITSANFTSQAPKLEEDDRHYEILIEESKESDITYTLRQIDGPVGISFENDDIVCKSVATALVSGSIFEMLTSLGYRKKSAYIVRSFTYHKDFGNPNHVQVCLSSHQKEDESTPIQAQKLLVEVKCFGNNEMGQQKRLLKDFSQLLMLKDPQGNVGAGTVNAGKLGKPIGIAENELYAFNDRLLAKSLENGVDQNDSSESARRNLAKEFENMSSNSIDTSNLDSKSKALLFLLSLAAFTEWEREFLKNYKLLLQYRFARGIDRGNFNKDAAALYALMKAAINRKCQVFNPQSAPGLDHGQANHFVNFTDERHHSILHRSWNVYRMDIFLKMILIIFLLKLPFFCYILTTGFYILYCCGAFNFWLRMYHNARNSTRLQNMLQQYHANVIRLQSYFQRLLVVRQTRPPFSNAQQTGDNVTNTGEDPQQLQEELDGANIITRDQMEPLPLHKVAYQILVAFLLSLLPWWDTSALYV
ncbi:hypothetical protein BdWA1_000187 [Babesia duncani]|uniref:Uncharacterized protein n=1 Tax=Babesia duncani TaxID=323732 RepID=A0AAD9PMM7_9APIC|nr:hypothetical protein BdWA1_000187 [Babesia duncani]